MAPEESSERHFAAPLPYTPTAEFAYVKGVIETFLVLGVRDATGKATGQMMTRISVNPDMADRGRRNFLRKGRANGCCLTRCSCPDRRSSVDMCRPHANYGRLAGLLHKTCGDLCRQDGRVVAVGRFPMASCTSGAPCRSAADALQAELAKTCSPLFCRQPIPIRTAGLADRAFRLQLHQER